MSTYVNYYNDKARLRVSEIDIGYNIYSTQSNETPGVVGAEVATGDGLYIAPSGNVISPVTGNFANYNLGADWNGSNGNVTTVGSNGDPSFYGTYDQTGQVWEWNETSLAGIYKGVRGGSWLNTATYIGSSYRGFTGAGPSFGNGNVGFRIGCSIDNSFPSIDFITVGDPGNNHDVSGFGKVDYTYKISKYPITNEIYCTFLNFKAKTNTYFLYNNNMSTNIYYGGIDRNGSDGSYVYTVKNNFNNKPVVYISWFDTLRFANWLHNGGANGDTENGAYTLNGALSGVFTRNTESKFWLPTEDEWYKAAYYRESRKYYI